MRMCRMKYKNLGGNKSFTIKEMNERLDTTNVIYYLLIKYKYVFFVFDLNCVLYTHDIESIFKDIL